MHDISPKHFGIDRKTGDTNHTSTAVSCSSATDLEVGIRIQKVATLSPGNFHFATLEKVTEARLCIHHSIIEMVSAESIIHPDDARR
jgi:hypothetical protein